jgi:hypothetical protein
MKTKFLFKLLATTSMLLITLTLSNFTTFAEDTPPSIPDPFGGTDEDAPPSLELDGGDEDAPPSLELNGTGNNTGANNTGGNGGSGSGGSGSGGSGGNGGTGNNGGGSPVLLNKDSKSKTKTVTDLDNDGDIDSDDEILFAQQQEQDISETGPEIVYVLLLGLLGNLGFNLRKLQKNR